MTKDLLNLELIKKKNNNKNQTNTLKDNIVGDKNMKFLIQNQKNLKMMEKELMWEINI